MLMTEISIDISRMIISFANVLILHILIFNRKGVDISHVTFSFANEFVILIDHIKQFNINMWWNGRVIFDFL